MKIRFVSGPKSGIVEHLQPSIANVLIASGMAEHIPFKNYAERLSEESAQANKNLLPPVVVTWVNAFGNLNGRHYISAKCSRATCGTLVYDGRPSALESITFIHSAGCGQPEKIPAAVCEKYRSAYRAPATLGRDEVAHAIAASPARTKEDWEAEQEVAAARARFEDIDARNPGQIPYGRQHYAPSVDRPYDLPKKK